MKKYLYKIEAGAMVLLIFLSTLSIAVSSDTVPVNETFEENLESSNNVLNDTNSTANNTLKSKMIHSKSDSKTTVKDLFKKTTSSNYISEFNKESLVKYNTAKLKYHNSEIDYDTAKEAWLTAIDEYRQFKNSEFLNEAIRKANTYIINTIERLINHLNKVLSHVNGTQYLDEDQKNEIKEKLNSYISWLEEKKDEITVETTGEFLKNLSRIINIEWRKIKHFTKWIIWHIISEKIYTLTVKTENAAEKINDKLEYLQSKGFDTEALESLLSDSNEKINLSKDKYESAREKYVGITNFDDVSSLLRNSKMFLLESKRYLKNALHILREIVRELKNLNNKEVSLSGIGTLIAEGDGSVFISCNGTIDLSGEDGTLIITDYVGDISISLTGFGDKIDLDTNKWKYTGTGSVGVTGTYFVIELQANNIHINAEGTGSATLTGTGSYNVYKRISDENKICINDKWCADGASVTII